MPSSTVEDYVKAIYALQRDSSAGEATVARLASVLGVTKGSVTAMVRKLCEGGLADSARYGGITLTEKGRTLALDVVRRHRLIEVFLVDVLGFDWSEVHDEAERLEHAMSARLLDRLDEYLGRPAIDPHGDPIPDAQGRLPVVDHTPLAKLGSGDKGVVARVSDQAPEFLDFAASSGLTPGSRVAVVEVVPAAGSMRVEPFRKPAVSLSLAAAGNVCVEQA